MARQPARDREPRTETVDKVRRDIWRRREFLGGLGWLAVIGSQVVGLVAFVRLLFRRAPIEPPTVFAAGRPGDYRRDTVSDRFLSRWRVYVVREGDELFVIHARCTHLGCTPRWRAREDKFKCPCHGSGFTREGINFEGPAPRPLERAGIALDPGGDLLIDVGKRIRPEGWHDEQARILITRPRGRA